MLNLAFEIHYLYHVPHPLSDIGINIKILRLNKYVQPLWEERFALCDHQHQCRFVLAIRQSISFHWFHFYFLLMATVKNAVIQLLSFSHQQRIANQWVTFFYLVLFSASIVDNTMHNKVSRRLALLAYWPLRHQSLFKPH